MTAPQRPSPSQAPALHRHSAQRSKEDDEDDDDADANADAGDGDGDADGDADDDDDGDADGDADDDDDGVARMFWSATAISSQVQGLLSSLKEPGWCWAGLGIGFCTCAVCPGLPSSGALSTAAAPTAPSTMVIVIVLLYSSSLLSQANLPNGRAWEAHADTSALT
ncbi:predicted protein [Plenodomus lingam JN3]|uniref:Predicted protein n=1 Tax=Leptosphaeria maculans (strain JN3 / isolate v23.1.3 / race Av1-4-5-6-7-8) TaxID=985895 RepID=E5A823_LEPMJ|nr:predicted protein [Plenodomus lingam JN3]CBX99768.1 predicted protein [Plenodomus lingam JN3]